MENKKTVYIAGKISEEKIDDYSRKFSKAEKN